jgi:predicted transglutaminase-like cysteine proteinase
MNEKSETLFHLLFFKTLILFSCLTVIQVPSVFSKERFEPWDDAVFDAIARDYGEDAGKRMRKVIDLIVENQDKSVNEKLKLVNDFMNRLPWIADPDIWKQEDYWATGLETITTFGGDCEDIAIAKWMALLLMGIPDDKMGFGYVQTSEGERHMVLLYKESPDIPSVILDNQNKKVISADKRRDLIAIYAFKNDGSLFVIKDDGKNDRELKKKFDDKKLAKWRGVKERAGLNREKYEKYNGGRPLVPEWIIY